MPITPARLVVLLACAMGTACASSGAVPRPFPTPGPAATASSPAGNTDNRPTLAGEALVATALELQGVPYRNGGSDTDGFDCSGLVWYVFARQGLAVPRTVAAQFQLGTPVQPDALRPGDLVFFETAGSPASHVGVVVGADLFVHAPRSRGIVRTEHLSSQYWSSRFVGARRIT
ncbi:MAG: C40 family peptidase [Vicinamibacterales bacterium]